MILWLPLLFSILGALFAPISATAALLLLPTAKYAGRHAWRKDQSVIAGLMLGWLIWLPVSTAISLAPGLSLPQAAVLLCLPLAWLTGSALKARPKFDEYMARGLAVLLSVLILWGLLQGPNTTTLKPQGPLNDPNAYAALINLLMLPIVARYLAFDLVRTPGWYRTGHLALLAGCAFVEFLVSSRGAVLALLLVLPALLWLARNQPQFWRKMLLLATVMFVAYFAARSVSGGISVAHRLFETIQGGDPARIMLLRSAWLMVMDHPWLGTGLGSFRMLYPQYRFPGETATAGGWVHNDYLQLWLEAGLPMLLLLLAVALWVAWSVWLTLRQGGRESLLRMGYLAGIAVILLHAVVNFLFFFSLISLIVGLYLAKVIQYDETRPSVLDIRDHERKRAISLASGGYAFLLGYLLIGQVAVDSLLGEARFIQRVLYEKNVIYPRYQVAYWLSVLAPFHPTPQQVMGLELSDGYLFDRAADDGMRKEALARMEAAWQRAPCYLPYANAAMAVIHQNGRSETLIASLREHGQRIVVRNLECNPRHGLSYYHAGWLAKTDDEALMWLHAGMAASPFLGERLLLATAILARTSIGQEEVFDDLAQEMARNLGFLEANPASHPDQNFWAESQYKLYRLAGKHFLELVPPSKTRLSLPTDTNQ